VTASSFGPTSPFDQLGLEPVEGASPTAAPLTRRQARELEVRRAMVEATPAVPVPPVEVTFDRVPFVAELSTELAGAPDKRKPSRKARRARAAASTGPKVTQPKAKRTRRRRGSSALSLGAMLFAGALLVGMSIPANLFAPDELTLAGSSVATPEVDSLASVEKAEAQSLQMPTDAVASAPVRDTYAVTSYAELLAAKYVPVSQNFAPTTGAVRWPFPYAVDMTDGFGERWGGFHKGVDFVPGGGTPIYAVADGVVEWSGEDSTGYGNNVILNHTINGQSVDTLYAHMISGSSPLVSGQAVKVGDFIGLVGDTGMSYGAHLHLEVHLDGVPVDPYAWLQANAVN
jgi:murein DD-endopeptidase MepM/ murein hydrolase activator NlpD